MLFFVALGSVLMAVWGLYASGSGAFLLALYLILHLILSTGLAKRYIDTRRKKRILLFVFTITITIALIIILAIVLENENEAALEIVSFIIYLFMAYFVFRFIEEYRLNKKLMKNQIYIYSYKLMPMLRFKSSGSGAQGTMMENNAEYFYFFICSTQFIFWTLLAGLLLPDESKFVGFSLSSVGLAIIYLYIESRIQQGKSFKYIDCLLVERAHFMELQEQALTMKDQEQNQKQENTIVRERRGIESDVMRNKDIVLNRHLEWRTFYTILGQKCHSKLK